MRLPRASSAAAFMPNKGIKLTQTLRAQDIGNVGDPAAIKGTGYSPIPAGTSGKLNTSMVEFGTKGADFPRDPHTANDPLNPYKPAEGEIGGDTSKRAAPTGTPGTDDYRPANSFIKDLGERGGIAELFGVGVRTVERWFAMLDKRGRRELYNCVPVAAKGKRAGILPAFKLDKDGRSVTYNYTRHDGAGNEILGSDGQPETGIKPQFGSKMRVYMCAALAVEGGMQRVPLYTKGGGKAANIPYVYTIHEATIAGCVQSMYDLQAGFLDDTGDVPLSKAWIQLNIVPGGDGSGWDLVILMFFPYPWEYRNEDDFEKEPPIVSAD